VTIPAGKTADATLIERTRAGDMGAFDELYRRHVDDAAKVARIVTNNSDEAQDVVAEAFTRLLDRLRAGGGPEGEVTPYLRTIVRRLAIDRHRSTQRGGQPEDPAVLEVLPTADDPMARVTDRNLVRQAFETLPERWQQVLWHTEIEGRSPASLAPALGSSPNAVAALAYRAREGLRQAFLSVNLSADVPEGCRNYAPKVAAYVRDTLPAAAAAEMREHLSGCAYCRERRDEFMLLVSDMRGVLWPALLLPASVGVGAAVVGAAAGGGLLAWLTPGRWAGKGARVMATTGGIAAAGAIAAAVILSSTTGNEPEPVGAGTPPAVVPPVVEPEPTPTPTATPEPPPPAVLPPLIEALPPVEELPPVDPVDAPEPVRAVPPLPPSPTPAPPPPSPSPAPPPPTPPDPVTPPPPGLLQIDGPDDVQATVGESVTFTASAVADPAITDVHWERRNDDQEQWRTVTGPKWTWDGQTSTLTVQGVGSNHDGAQFRAVFTTSSGPIPTDPATLTVVHRDGPDGRR
jgi:RNA polymerase sigma factor (sigma-70 family)